MRGTLTWPDQIVRRLSPARPSGAAPLDLWAIVLDSVSDVRPLLPLLAAEERERATSGAAVAQRRRAAVGRAGLRLILGQRLGVEPSAVPLRYGPWGKPELPGVQFNLSHSGELAIVGVSDDAGAVGIDLERLAPRRRLDLLSRRLFSDTERDRLSRLTGTHGQPSNGRRQLSGRRQQSGDQWQAAGQQQPDLRWFYRYWTAKEAAAKALGVGFTIPPRRFRVTALSPRRALVEAPDAEAPIEVRWLESNRFVAALARSGG